MDGRLTGAILAAGRGLRLRKSVDGLPKALVQLGGQPLLMRQINLLQGAGAGPIHVIVNSETKHLMQAHALRLPENVDLLTADTPNSLESLLRLGERIARRNFLLMTVDTVLYSSELRSFVAKATKLADNPDRRLDGILGVVKWRGDVDPLFVRISDDDLVIGLGDAQSSLVTAGIYLLSTEIFTYGGEARQRGLGAMRLFLAMLVDRGLRFATLELRRAIDVDNAGDLSDAREMIACESQSH
jgi:choline kinase